MIERAKGYCITCPKCGAVQQRGFETDSIMTCVNCHYEFYTFLENGLMIELPASWVEDIDFVNRMKAFVVAAGCGHGMIVYDLSGTNNSASQTGLMLEEEDRKTIRAIRKITRRGRDAEVRCRRDGSLAVYEVKRNIET